MNLVHSSLEGHYLFNLFNEDKPIVYFFFFKFWKIMTFKEMVLSSTLTNVWDTVAYIIPLLCIGSMKNVPSFISNISHLSFFSTLIIVSFPLITLDLIGSYFSSFLRWTHKWLICNYFFSFLIYAFNAVNFPTSTAFAASHEFS